jgi:transposase
LPPCPPSGAAAAGPAAVRTRSRAIAATTRSPHRDRLHAQGIVPILARRRTPHGSGLGVCRWVVERTHAWLHRYRRLTVRYERRDDVHQAFLTLACVLIWWNYLKSKNKVF